MENNDIVLSLRGISKIFPAVKALQNVDFTLRESEIHALMGENGAGKSTLVKVITGVYTKDSGEIRIAGNDGPVNIRSPQDAQNLGISTVYQEVTLCPNLTVAENLYIGRGNYKFINWKAQEKRATELLKQLNIPARANQQLGTCSLAVQQMVAIARAVDMDCKVLILDEPTSSLDENEVELLFTLMRVLKSHGVGIIFITHFLEQVYEVCDKITVLRHGELGGEYSVKELPRVKLISAMLGKEAEDMTNLMNMKRELPETEVIYEATDLATTEGIQPFDFNIRKGEVNGFTGLLGSGRSESVRAIFAADKVTGGKVRVMGKEVKITNPKDAMKNGIAYIPESRRRDGIIGDLSVRENMILALQVLRGFFHPISRAESEKMADEYIKLLEIKTASKETPIKLLSGGNQQKVILARWFLTHPKYMILDEPTRGIDVGTKIQIQKLVLELARHEKSVTFISSEIPEMLSVCQRLIVMRDRKIVGELKGEELSPDVIMQTIAGGKAKNE